jgi:hypothetical protein
MEIVGKRDHGSSAANLSWLQALWNGASAFSRTGFEGAWRSWSTVPFLQRVLATGAVVVIRLRKDAALFELPDLKKRRGKGAPRKYGRGISLARRGAHRQACTTTRMILYGREQERVQSQIA